MWASQDKGLSEGPPHTRLPGGRPDGVFFCVIVLFAHFFCKEKEQNTYLLGLSHATCILKA